VIVWAVFSPQLALPYANPFHGFMTSVLGTLAIFMGGIALSRHRERRRKRAPAETICDLE
jgi:hypothetical protein